MCIAPLTLVGGVMTACHECWQCRERAINDWVGRNIAESKTAVASHAVTLTYGNGDHPAAAILTYSDVQKYFKKLRFNGFPLRYFAIGEYGSAKGRAHWHLMIYWLDKVPPHEIRQNFMEPHWEHGFSFWDKPSHQAIRYNCKYIQKDIGKDERQGHCAMSKKPPLGAAYFEQLAGRYVAQELAPRSLEYSFPEVKRRNKSGVEEVVTFMLKDRPAELFVEAYQRKWAAEHGERPAPRSEFLDQFLDARLRERARILEWFAALPPNGNLNPAQRLDVDRWRKRLAELDYVEPPPPTGHNAWSPEVRDKALNRVAYAKALAENPYEQEVEQWWRKQIEDHRDGNVQRWLEEFCKEQGIEQVTDYSDFNRWLSGYADREFRRRGK